MRFQCIASGLGDVRWSTHESEEREPGGEPVPEFHLSVPDAWAHRPAQPARCNPLLASLRYSIEEVHDTRLQRILGAHDDEPISLHGLLEDLRTVS